MVDIFHNGICYAQYTFKLIILFAVIKNPLVIISMFSKKYSNIVIRVNFVCLQNEDSSINIFNNLFENGTHLMWSKY